MMLTSVSGVRFDRQHKLSELTLETKTEKQRLRVSCP